MKHGAAIIAACLLASCESEQRVVRYKPFLANLPGAQTQSPIVGKYAEFSDPTAVPDQKIVRENPDGTKTLIAKSVRHMMTHLQNTLAEEKYGLLYEQVVSEETKRQYRDLGKEPEEVIEYLKQHKQDINVLFSRMPFAEQSPSVILEQPGNKTFHLKLTGLATKGSNFQSLWAIMEKGNWKFLWAE